ncbi:MAG: site-specific integrase [Clostridiales bacterium]|nr:site-specific integrase [Clostridiales bacterium]
MIASTKNFSIAYKPIDKITRMDVKNWIIEADKKYAYSTINNMKGFISSAFNEAINDDLVRKNPFKVKLKGVISDDTVPKKSLTEEEMNSFLCFMQNSNVYSKHYDIVYILFYTGMRISELCGLTKDNIDFDNNCIIIDHQISSCIPNKKGAFIESPKSKAGYRSIPMIKEVRKIFRKLVDETNESQIDPVIDGLHGFLFLTRKGMVSNAIDWDNRFKRMLAKYREEIDSQFPEVTPHICRHTFCTLMANKGMNIKTLQYIMGHEKMEMTADYYADGSLSEAQKELDRIISG